MLETARVQNWVQSTLAADAGVAALVGTRIWAGHAPAGTARPYLRGHVQASQDANALDTARCGVRVQYTVAAVVEGGAYAPAEAIMDAVDTALTGLGLVVTAELRLTCQRIEALYWDPEDLPGASTQVRTVGAVYEILAEAI